MARANRNPVSDTEPSRPILRSAQQQPPGNAEFSPQRRELSGLLAVLVEEKRRRGSVAVCLANEDGIPQNGNPQKQDGGA